MKREREAIDQMDLDLFSEEEELIRQVQKSREDRKMDVFMIKSRE
ncbi:hypothetical protein [Alteribacillus sp. YIM 98480]|nr:hypothetical protein [Alteribacillus sp. YIM 98480]